MNPMAIVEILKEVEKTIAEEATKHRLRKRIFQTWAIYGQTSFEHFDQVDSARRLIAASEPKSLIRDRLMKKYGISTRTAYRIINEAEMCHAIGTEEGSNRGNEEVFAKDGSPEQGRQSPDTENRQMTKFFVLFGEKFSEESGGELGYMVNETDRGPATFEQMSALLDSGETVGLRKADQGEMAAAEELLASLKAKRGTVENKQSTNEKG